LPESGVKRRKPAFQHPVGQGAAGCQGEKVTNPQISPADSEPQVQPSPEENQAENQICPMGEFRTQRPEKAVKNTQSGTHV
jgi:hypothetical protein